MSLPSSGTFNLQITGTLQDLVANLNSLVADLQAVNVDPTPLKNAQVLITLTLLNLAQAQFISIENAVATFRGQVAGTSITVRIQLSLSA